MITVGIADDHKEMREAICLLFSKTNNCEITLTGENGFELLAKLHKAEALPAVIFMDVHMPLLDGVSTVYYINRYFPKVYVIALSYYYHRMVIHDMFDAGAAGYILKGNLDESMVHSAIQTVLSGMPFLDPEIEQGILSSLTMSDTKIDPAVAILNTKERTFLQLFATSLSIDQIANLMNVATDSIYNYQKSLKGKLGFSSRQEFTVFALQHGIAKIARYKTLSDSALKTKSNNH